MKASCGAQAAQEGSTTLRGKVLLLQWDGGALICVV
jgi:hypothetical protein